VRFDRESWRKLYVAESLEHRLLPVFSRGLRDYLLRFAEQDGTLFRSRKPVDDLCKALNAEPKERKLVADAVNDLLRIGYLSQDGERLWITKFVEAQTASTPGAKRQAAYNDRKKAKAESTATTDATSDVTDRVTTDVINDVTLTSHPTRPDETRRDPPEPKAESGSTSELANKSKLWLENPFDAQFVAPKPQAWPEVVGICTKLHAVFGGRPQFPRVESDSRVRCILGRFAEGYSRAELERAVELAAKDPHIAGNRQFQTVQTILRDGAQVDKFMALAEGGAERRESPEDLARRTAERAREESRLNAQALADAKRLGLVDEHGKRIRKAPSVVAKLTEGIG
jgi:hypothetical protein